MIWPSHHHVLSRYSWRLFSHFKYDISFFRHFVDMPMPIVVLSNRTGPLGHQLRLGPDDRRQLQHQHAHHGHPGHTRTRLPNSVRSSGNWFFLWGSSGGWLLCGCDVTVSTVSHLRERRDLLGQVLFSLSERNPL